jgi:hypothetical protein
MLHAVYRMTRTKRIDQAAGQEHLHLPVSHRVLRHVRFVLMLIKDSDLVAALNGLSYIGQAQDMPWRDPVPVVWIGKGQGKDTEVDQILSALSSCQSPPRSCDARKRFTALSEGKTVVVAPSSAPMLAMT